MQADDISNDFSSYLINL